ncbi:unnamed protein product [Ectocarpus sp. CCAP 1310/34]|nr:unnamed protein product [Ectocarpus sp. CCAP 1310/34]
MSTAAPGPAPAVTKPGKCQRIVFIGSTRYLVEHKWRFDAARNKVRLETKFVNKKSPNRPSDKETRYVENTEEAVSSEALEMADRVLKKKRDVFLRENGGDAGGSSSGKKRRRNADDELADPVIVALRGGGRTRSGVETGKPDEQEDAESFLAFLNSKESSSDALEFLASKGLDAAKEVRRRIRELDVLARVGASLKRAIEQAQKQRSTSDGHRTWQTLLTAAAFMVEDEEGSQLSAQRTAAAINVRRQSFNFAVGRAKKLNPDVRPTEALKDGVYWFSPRAKRSDAASDELVSLMRQYWHTDEVSRASGNSADRDMWISSKSPNAERHPRRQLIEVGGGDAVYAKFLKWADYRSFKSRQGPEFTDPGRTLFLSTRCKCQTLPVMEQCACKIHSQQVLYIEALANVDMASHGDCSCRWCTVDGGSKWRETWKHLGTFSDAIACPKVNLRAEDPEDNVGFMGRKPECSAFKCKECGFGGAKGIPTCTRLETSQKTVEWKEFEDVITVPASADGKIKAKKLANQTIPKEGRLCDLWKAFKQDSKLYMAHHATAKHHFVGANTPRNDAQTTTEDPEDIKLALKREEGGRSTGEEESRLAGLGGVRVMQVSGRWKGVEGSGPVEPMSGEEVVVVRKETRVHMLRTRLASCFCSACQRFQYEDCYVNRAYPDLVPPMREGKVKETVIMDTGVALESEGKAGITFRSRQSTCEMARLTGTQWEASDSKIAFNLWKELEREEESTLLVRFRRQPGI